LSRWFRHYAGMMRDAKLVSVALHTKQPVERVLWVWGAILESAAEINDGGRYAFDSAEAAYFLRADTADIDAIEAGLSVAGRVADGRVVHWGDRQFQSDRSASRQAAYRERQRGNDSDGDKTDSDGGVTAASRHGDAPETETETNTEKKESSRAPRCAEHKFEEFWKIYPKRKGDNPKAPARKLFFALVKQGVDPDSIIRGLRLAVEKNRDKIGTEFIPQAVKWLRDRRWEDYTDAPDVPSGFVISLKTPEQARVWLEAKAAAGEDTTFFRSQLERGGSITVPSEYPPGYEHKAA
jgi:hypothetical protein